MSRKRPLDLGEIHSDRSIGDWVQCHRLSFYVENAFKLEGVKKVSDLSELVQDVSRMSAVHMRLSSVDYSQLMRVLNSNVTVSTSSSWTYVQDQKRVGSEPLQTTEVNALLKQRLHSKRLKRITALNDRLVTASSLDLLIMLDCTGSMGAFIDSAKRNIAKFVNSILEVYPDVPTRVTFVGYRDICNTENHVVLPFTAKISDFERTLSKVSARGGGRPLTDLIGALGAAAQLNWTSRNRILYHVGDYPCHGVEFHRNLHDRYPQGDPSGKHPSTSLKRLADLKVKYYFGKLTDHTDKMIARFNELMGGTEYVKTTPMNSTNMMDVVSIHVTSVLTSNLSSSSSINEPSVKVAKDFTISAGKPAVWSAIATEKALAYQMTVPASTDALAAYDPDYDKALEDFPDTKPVLIQCAPNPFAKGQNKIAYYAQQVSGKIPVLSRAIVLKEPINASSRQQNVEKFAELVSCQRAAAFLAQEYNTVQPAAGCAAIEFAPVRVVQFLARPGKPCFIEEDQIPGEWERYSNNTGWCAPNPTPDVGTDHAAVQAFSHWTHHRSGGKLMVTDCQGSYDAASHTFHLTDPSIHCTSLLSYGGTNMGEQGFERFFKTHRCNAMCKALGLPEGTKSK